MKVISPRIHDHLNFLTVVLFLLAPTVLSLSTVPAMFAYCLVAVHLRVTQTSDFSFSIHKIIPFKVHSWIERLVGPTLIKDLFTGTGYS